MDYKSIITISVEHDPTSFYKRIHVMFPGEFRNWTPGLEKAAQSKRLMIEFLIKKAELSGNTDVFLKSL